MSPPCACLPVLLLDLYLCGISRLICYVCSSVVDIWSLQPQPHLQPRATLRTPTSASSHETVTTANAPAAGDENERPASGVPADGTVPKHWGEVVINPRKKKRSRPGLNLSDDRDSANVFGVLNVA